MSGKRPLSTPVKTPRKLKLYRPTGTTPRKISDKEYVQVISVNNSNIVKDLQAQALVSLKKYMPPPLPYFKVNIKRATRGFDNHFEWEKCLRSSSNWL
jgi:hypothetical protein